jgi:hypothetical protein
MLAVCSYGVETIFVRSQFFAAQILPLSRGQIIMTLVHANKEGRKTKNDNSQTTITTIQFNIMKI